MKTLRLLPLLASATEMVHALGLGRFQVGRSHECDYPAEVSALPVCTRPTIPVTGGSAEIDRLVKQRLASALSIYEVDTEMIRALRPTHIITQTQCKVCAVSLDDVERALRQDLATDACIVSLEAFDLEGVWADICRVAAACDCVATANRVVNRWKQKMAEIECVASAFERVPVATIEWLDPLMAAGNWVPELVRMAGGANCFGVAGEHSPWIAWQDLREADPDVIAAIPCGFDLTRTRAEMPLLQSQPGWADLKAVRTGNVFLCDGNQFMNRSGPRLVESLRIFAELLHPGAFSPDFEGVGWERFSSNEGVFHQLA